jgi:hypothetical protein
VALNTSQCRRSKRPNKNPYNSLTTSRSIQAVFHSKGKRKLYPAVLPAYAYKEARKDGKARAGWARYGLGMGGVGEGGERERLRKDAANCES